MGGTDTSATSTAAAAPATRVRYGVLAFLCGLFFLLYLDRICISKAAPHIEAELNISHTAMGFVFGAFTVAYGLFEVPTGRWGDRYGSRRVLMRIVLWWSAFTALTGCIWPFVVDSGLRLPLPATQAGVPIVFNSFMLLLLVRFLFGAGEAGAVPNAARVVARWFPSGKRGPAQGLINTAALVGGAVAPIAAAYVIELYGWRWTFGIFGLLGVVWAMAFYAWYRDEPNRHPGVNEAERHFINGGVVPCPEAEAPSPVPWRRVVRSPNVWLLGGVITCNAFVSYMYFFWYPTYLEEGRQVDALVSGWLSGMVLAAGAIGCTLGGYLADAVVRRTGNKRWSRCAVGCGAMSTASLALALSVSWDSVVATSLFTALAALSAMLMMATWWSTVTEISGKHVGALFGLMNSMGVPGAVTSQLFFGYFADYRQSLGYQGRALWDPGFYVYSIVLLLGAVGWLFVDSTKSVVEPEGKLAESGGE
jgi:MFS family permease